MFEDFPRLEDAKKWAKGSKRKLQSFVEVDYFDSQEDGWRATLWLEGLPAQDLLIHVRQQTKCNLTGKSVVLDAVSKTVQKQHLKEIWVNRLTAIN